MIESTRFSLSPAERIAIDELLGQVSPDPTLEQMWLLMDRAWERCGCDNRKPDPELMTRFYSDPVWLLNGMFIEQHDVSLGHRQAITFAVADLSPQRVVDFGGGFGTLARLMAIAMPSAEVAICEPYPPRHGIESCKPYTNIGFVPGLSSQHYDVLVSTDVLEHVPDPIALLAQMVDSVRLGGHLLIANCFYPVILCHLPCTFHLRNSFDAFCCELGLEVVGPCEGSHATIYRRSLLVEPDWPRLRMLERRSQVRFQWQVWTSSHLMPWKHRARLAVSNPLHYPRKLVAALRSRV